MNATVHPRLSRLVGRVEVGGPLQSNLDTRPALEDEVAPLPRHELAEAAWEEGTAGDLGEHLGRRPAEGAVAGDEARERGRDEVAALVGDPVHAANPLDGRGVVGAVARFTRPCPHHHLSEEGGEALVSPPWRAALGGDELDEPVDERQAVFVIAGEARFARLTELRHVAHERDRARAAEVPLGAPRDDGRVVHRAIEREVDLHVPLEGIHLRRGTRDAGVEVRSAAHAAAMLGVIGDVVRERVPVSRGRLGHRAIRPELCEHPREVTQGDDIRRVGRAGRWVEGTPITVLRPEWVVAVGAGRDVDGALVQLEVRLRLDDLHDPARHLFRLEDRSFAGLEIEPVLGAT